MRIFDLFRKNRNNTELKIFIVKVELECPVDGILSDPKYSVRTDTPKKAIQKTIEIIKSSDENIFADYADHIFNFTVHHIPDGYGHLVFDTFEEIEGEERKRMTREQKARQEEFKREMEFGRMRHRLMFEYPIGDTDGEASPGVGSH